MPTRNIKLTDHDDQLVEGQIASGRYKNASEVLRAGLRLLEQQEREDEQKLAVLRGLADDAFDAIDRGEGTTLEGEQQLADFIGGIGRRVARCATRGSSGT